MFKQNDLAGEFDVAAADGYSLSINQAAFLAVNDQDGSLSVIRAWRPAGQAARSSLDLVLSEGARAIGRPLYGRFTEGNSHVSAFVMGERLSVVEVREDGFNLAEYADINADMAELAEVYEDSDPSAPAKRCLFTIEEGQLKARAVGATGPGEPFQVDAWQDLTIVDFRVAFDADPESSRQQFRIMALDSNNTLLSARCSVGGEAFSGQQFVAYNVLTLDSQFISKTSDRGDRLFDLDMNLIYGSPADGNAGQVVGYRFGQFCALYNGAKTKVLQGMPVLRKLQDGRFVDVRRSSQTYFALDGSGNLYRAVPDAQGHYSASKIVGPDNGVVQSFRIDAESRVNAFFQDGTVAWDAENSPEDKRPYFVDSVPQNLTCLPIEVSDTFEDVFLVETGRAVFAQPDGSHIKFIYDTAGGVVTV